MALRRSILLRRPLGSVAYRVVNPRCRRALSQLPLQPAVPPAKAEPAVSASSTPTVDFNDTRVAYSAVSTLDLLRGVLVFKLCSIRPLVNHADLILRRAYSFFGRSLTEAVVRQTFFKHFCAGETATTIRPRVESLRRAGVAGILDFAAEADINQMVQEPATTAAYKEGEIQCRVYDYQSERQCDAHVKTFLECIHAVKDVTPEGFAAIKLTALGNPMLLERMSSCIVESRRLFQKFDTEHKGWITRKQFSEGYNRFFVPCTDGTMSRLLARLDPGNTDRIDYIEWSNTLRLEDIPDLTSRCKETGPLKMAALDEQETKLMLAMRDRIDQLANAAQAVGVRLMIDAEQTYFQEAIDNIVTDLQRRYNKTYPVIFNTYQCYLKDSLGRLETDMDRARRQGYHFAAKLVRGAYMVSERKRAQDLAYPSPIHDTIDHTHANYDAAVEKALSAIARGDKVEILIASHNQRSIEKTLGHMHRLDMPPSPRSTVYFGQLLGMADHLTFTLGKHGYKAYKYVPYGKVGEVLPYLIRRAQENSDVLGGVGKDVALMTRELGRRAKAAMGMGSS